MSQPTHADDATKIADAFRQIEAAGRVISEVLSRNEALNDSVPESWPLNLSADEFAEACADTAEFYDDIARQAKPA